MLKAEGLSYVEIGERLGWTYTNTISTIALFIALGGTSYAMTLPRNSVGSAQIKPHAVGASELRAGAVRSSDVRNRSLGVQDLSLPARESLRGRAGRPGPPGPAGPTYTAAVTGLGTKVRGNALGATSRGSNESLVGFARNMDDCVSTATLANVDGTSPPPGRSRHRQPRVRRRRGKDLQRRRRPAAPPVPPHRRLLADPLLLEPRATAAGGLPLNSARAARRRSSSASSSASSRRKAR